MVTDFFTEFIALKLRQWHKFRGRLAYAGQLYIPLSEMDCHFVSCIEKTGGIAESK